MILNYRNGCGVAAVLSGVCITSPMRQDLRLMFRPTAYRPVSPCVDDAKDMQYVIIQNVSHNQAGLKNGFLISSSYTAQPANGPLCQLIIVSIRR